MVDLSDICGLPFFLDTDSGALQYAPDIGYDEERHVGLREILPILLNKFLKYPEDVYTQYVGINDGHRTHMEKGLTYDVFRLPQGLLGIEFVKTHVYYSEKKSGKFSSLVEVMQGEITIVIQKNSDIKEFYPTTPVDDVQIITLGVGDRMAVPTGVYYTFVNTGTVQAVFTVVAISMQSVNYETLAKEKGLAYFIISKNARLEVVANPKYRIINKPGKFTWKRMPDNIKERFIHKHTTGSVPLFESLRYNSDELATALS